MENQTSIPVGLSFGLAMNNKAMSVYSGMDEKERDQVIEAARNVNSKEEMEHLVSGLADNFMS